MRVIALLLCVFLVSCATEPFKSGQPVAIEGGSLGRTYKQAGKAVSHQDLISPMRSNSATQKKANAAQTWHFVSIVPASVGGFLIGYYAVASNVDSDSRTIGILTGVGLSAIGIGLRVHSENLLKQAVEIYNEGLSPASKKKTSDFLPDLPPVLFTSRGQSLPVFGLAGTWPFSKRN